LYEHINIKFKDNVYKEIETDLRREIHDAFPIKVTVFTYEKLMQQKYKNHLQFSTSKIKVNKNPISSFLNFTAFMQKD